MHWPNWTPLPQSLPEQLFEASQRSEVGEGVCMYTTHVGSLCYKKGCRFFNA